ncbi:MAG: (2Fe-2S)-binding protein [Deltaproteobacteria bacterium]|nr:(2Fe-2S)-binding protein [Deltaproteobacteria bacterium]
MVNIVIDGKKIKAQEGATILEAARENGVQIPTLCSHESLEPSGACRLCVVEVKKGNRTRIVTSCIYQVDEGISVDTQSERVKGVRRIVMELLMARNPESEVIAELAEKLGVTPQKRFIPDEDKGKCILCRLCIKTCESIVGVSAIGFSGRGAAKIVGTPFDENSDVCIGCGACAYVCPTGHIQMESTEDTRTIWGRTFKMKACDVCGRYFAPEDQLKYISKKTGVPVKNLSTCVSCR